ncbi:MAG: hypothetical protein AB1642_10800 [Pseudomonadota bacterium]
MSAQPVSQLSGAELDRRRAASRKLGWALGAVVLAFYLLGFFIQR